MIKIVPTYWNEIEKTYFAKRVVSERSENVSEWWTRCKSRLPSFEFNSNYSGPISLDHSSY